MPNSMSSVVGVLEKLDRFDIAGDHVNASPPASTAVALDSLRTRTGMPRALRLRPDPAGLVFTTHYGAPIEPRNFVRSFKTRCDRAGVRPIRVHDTRHTCGSLLAALDVHPRVAMQILRHSKIDVTMEIYTHVPSELTRATLKKLGRSLDEIAS